MTITLLPYGPLVQVLGDAPLPFTTVSATAGELLDELHSAYPGLEPWNQRIALACGDALLGARSAIEDGSEIALIPPVSGG